MDRAENTVKKATRWKIRKDMANRLAISRAKSGEIRRNPSSSEVRMIKAVHTFPL